jgi:hypothetical protein
MPHDSPLHAQIGVGRSSQRRDCGLLEFVDFVSIRIGNAKWDAAPRTARNHNNNNMPSGAQRLPPRQAPVRA